jgi:flavin reductase (DIM6/NTAB) family NADH-FMN oxidoreductase RutF
MKSSPTLVPVQASPERRLRAALGQYATGVAVVTTMTPGGAPVGMTINSFSALSLDPPLILWCLRRSATRAAAFAAAPHFAINVLAAGQRELASRFARHDGDDGQRFGGVAWRRGPGGAPLLAGTVGAFACRRERALDGGDHVILIGHLDDYTVTAGRAPLVFHDGRYHALRPDPETLAATAASG